MFINSLGYNRERGNEGIVLIRIKGDLGIIKKDIINICRV